MRRQSSGVSSSNGDAVEDSRVADHRVQPSELIDGGADDRFAALGTVDRVVRRHGRPARGGDLFDDLVRHGRVGAFTVHGSAEVVDHHRCAATRQLDRVEAAEAPPRAGDYRDLTFEVDHVPLPVRTLTGVGQDPTVEQIFGQRVRWGGDRLSDRR